MSRFIIYNADRERIDVLQNDDSVQWLEHYQSAGEVKITARATRTNLDELVEGNRLYNTDSDTSARISHVDILDTGKEKTIVAWADITSKLLSDRVVMATENIRDVETGMYLIYSKNRGDLPIGVAPLEGFTETTDTEITWGQVLEAEEKLAVASGLGFKVVFDPETGAETFKVYKGVDRSKETYPGYIGYFSTDNGSLKNVTITSGSTNYKNVAVVAGAGEGAARTVRIVSIGSPAGENRRELFVDARDLQRDYQTATPTGEVDSQGNPIYSYESKTYSEAEYLALLDARGYEKLAEHLRDFSVTCDVVQTNMQFGVDYFLGDRMPIKLLEYGLQASARVAAATRIYEKEGYRVVAVLSDFETEGQEAG